MQNTTESLGARLATLIETNGLTTAALADRTGIPRVTLARRLRCPETLTLSEVAALASALQTTPKAIVCGESAA